MARSPRKAVKSPGQSRATKKVDARLDADPTRRSVIITFKRKDLRPNSDADKLEIVAEVCQANMTFFDAGIMLAGAAAIPVASDREVIGFDINEYEAPIVIASLTGGEIRQLESNGNVATVEEDGECHALESSVGFPPYNAYASYGSYPGAALRREQFFVEGQPSVLAETIPSGVSQIKAPAAWEASRGKAINVAVLDTGLDFNHPDLAPNFKGGVSCVPGETLMDGNGHGTHCAGTIAAAVNGAGVVGVAPAASVYGVKVLSNSGSGNWSWLIAGLDWCIKNKMRVVNMSLGGDTAPVALETMCNAAFNKGLLLIAAAGNTGGAVGLPARFASVIAVSAIDSANAIAGFSCRGAEIELCAPGVNILSTLPGGGYGVKNGTSMACPHASGAAALAWGGHRFVDNLTIRRLLAQTADNLGIPGRDPLFGYGRVDADQAASALTPPPAIPGIG